MQATLALMAAALADPLNARFALVSEGSLPLWPAGVLWAQSMWEQRSRIVSCGGDKYPNDSWRCGKRNQLEAVLYYMYYMPVATSVPQA